MKKVKENINNHQKETINTNPILKKQNGESSYENTLDCFLGDKLIAMESFIGLLKITREREYDIDADMLYALEKGFKDTMKDMRVAIGALDNAYKLVPTGHKYSPDKESTTCKNCGKKYDWQDMIRLEDIYGRYSCSECGHRKFEYAMHGGDLKEFPFVKEEA
jgi:DNA-directed RNA polymerase subunit RPC12/RpoP